MRKLPALSAIVLSAAFLLAMTGAQAQPSSDRDGRATAVVDTEAATDAEVGTDDDAGADAHDGAPSGFGQVMSVLTGLLQDAAQREATGRSDGFALDNPAIEISVTPVEGHDSLLRAPAARHATAGQKRHGTSARQLAGGTPE